MTAVAALLGAVTGGALVVAIAAWRGLDVRQSGRPALVNQVDQLTLRLGLAVAAGVVMAAATRWPVAALLAAAAGFVAPSLVGGKAARDTELARIEGIAAWAEMLRDTMAAAGGLEQSILATAPLAPPAIRPQVLVLAARLERERLTPPCAPSPRTWPTRPATWWSRRCCWPPTAAPAASVSCSATSPPPPAPRSPCGCGSRPAEHAPARRYGSSPCSRSGSASAC